MNPAVLVSWPNALLLFLVPVILGGMLPVFVVRCVVRVYPRGHARRAELVAEMASVKGVVERWVWLGHILGTAVFEGVPERRRAVSPGQRRRTRASLLVVALRRYRASISPLYNDVCRFELTCSAYALEAVELHGTVKGGWLMMRRLARCHPWAKGGFDRVPGRVEAKHR